MKPNFIFIGPDKSGSSWVFKILKKHPDVYMTPAKDPGYFDQHYKKGEQWYLSNFSGHNTESIIGECSHNYLFSKDAIQRIKKDLPNVKLMVCLREPIDRAFSAYLYLKKHNVFNGSFEEAIKAESELLNNGKYFSHLSSYLEEFKKEDILITTFDDLKQSPQRFIDQVYRFLNIENLELNDDDKAAKLPASTSRSKVISQLIKIVAIILRNLGFVKVLGIIKSWSFIDKLLYKPYTEKSKPKISPQTELELKNYYRAEIEGLDQLFPLHLVSKWKY